MEPTPAGLDWNWAYFFDVLNFIFILLALLLIQQAHYRGVAERLPRSAAGLAAVARRFPFPVVPWSGGLLLFLFTVTLNMLVWNTNPGQHLHYWGRQLRETVEGLPIIPEIVAMAMIIYGFLRFAQTDKPQRQVEAEEETGMTTEPHDFSKGFYIANMAFTAILILSLMMSLVSPVRLGYLLAAPWVLGCWQLAIVVYGMWRLIGTQAWLRNHSLVILTAWAFAALFAIVLPLPHENYLAVSAIRECLLLISFVVFIRLLHRSVLHRLQLVEEVRDRLDEEKEIIFSFMGRLAGGLEARKTLAESLDITSTLKEILSFSLESTHGTAGAIYLLQENREGKPELAAKCVQGYFGPTQRVKMDHIVVKQKMVHDLVLSERIPLGSGLIGQVAQTGNLELIADAESDPRVHQPSIDFLRIKTMVIVPLKDRNNVMGVLVVTNKQIPEGIVPFDENDESLLWSIADLAAITINNAKMHHDLADKERLEREIQIARDVQQLLLPGDHPSVEGFEIQGFNQPAWRVGGDYYDFIWLDRKRLLLVIADVAGKGVSGALTMGMVRTLLRAEAPRCKDCRELLQRINAYIYRDTKSDMFVSMMLAILDVEDKKLSFVRAGHEPLIVFGPSREEYRVYSPEGIALGLDPGPLFEQILEEKTIDLSDGDIFVLYTDGITEAMNSEHEEFTMERFIETIRTNRSLDSSNLVNAINTSVLDFTGDIPQHDDLTLVLVKVKGRKKQKSGQKVEMLPQRTEAKHVEKVRSLPNSHSAG